MKKLFFISVLALAGCAVPPQHPRVSAADDPSGACYASIEDDAQLAALKPHLMLTKPDAASLEMLTDAAKPTDDEKRAISLWAKRRNMCNEAGRAFRQQYFPAVVPVLEDVRVALLQLIADLYSGKKSYGQFNTERQQVASRLRAQLADLDRQQRGEFAARQDAQRAANAQAAQTMLLMQAMQPRPALLAAPPVINPTVNCTSFRTGNVTNTNCN